MNEKKLRKSYPGVPFAKPQKKVGRPKGRTYTVRKEIRLTPAQTKNWNPEKVRICLENDYLKDLYDLMVSKMQPKAVLTQKELIKLKEIEEVLNV